MKNKSIHKIKEQLNEVITFNDLDVQRTKTHIKTLKALQMMYGLNHVRVMEHNRAHTFYAVYDEKEKCGYLVVLLYGYDLENHKLKIKMGIKKYE